MHVASYACARRVSSALTSIPATHTEGCIVTTQPTSKRGLASALVSASTFTVKLLIVVKSLINFLCMCPQLKRDMCVFWMGPSTRMVRSSSRAVNTNAFAGMDRSAVCLAAMWTLCCQDQTASCPGGSRYQESAARSGCVRPPLRPVP